jgi:hypothetical protein
MRWTHSMRPEDAWIDPIFDLDEIRHSNSDFDWPQQQTPTAFFMRTSDSKSDELFLLPAYGEKVARSTG